MKMPNIMEMFRSAAAPAAPTGQQNPGNIPTPTAGNNGTEVSQTTAANGVVPTQEAKPESPLDNYKDLWNNEPINKDETQPAPDFSKQVTEAANKTDFTKSISADTFKKIAAGGEESIAAFADAMNAITRQSFSAASITANKLIEQKLAEAERKFADQIPAMLKKQNLSSSLREENPALSHASAAPLIAAIESQIIQKYPNATNAEIKSKATEYLKAFADAAAGNKPAQESNNTGPKQEDWSKFFDE